MSVCFYLNRRTRVQVSFPLVNAYGFVVELLSCVLLFWDPMGCSPPVSSVHGIPQARILEWVAISSSKESPWPRDRTQVSCFAGEFFTSEPPGKPACGLGTIYLPSPATRFNTISLLIQVFSLEATSRGSRIPVLKSSGDCLELTFSCTGLLNSSHLEMLPFRHSYANTCLTIPS